MGWEYHERPRDSVGRWVKKHSTKMVDLHISITPRTADELRGRAAQARLEMSEYVTRALMIVWELELIPQDQQQLQEDRVFFGQFPASVTVNPMDKGDSDRHVKSGAVYDR